MYVTQLFVLFPSFFQRHFFSVLLLSSSSTSLTILKAVAFASFIITLGVTVVCHLLFLVLLFLLQHVVTLASGCRRHCRPHCRCRCSTFSFSFFIFLLYLLFLRFVLLGCTDAVVVVAAATVAAAAAASATAAAAAAAAAAVAACLLRCILCGGGRVVHDQSNVTLKISICKFKIQKTQVTTMFSEGVVVRFGRLNCSVERPKFVFDAFDVQPHAEPVRGMFAHTSVTRGGS